MSYAFPFSPPINKTLEDVRQSIMNRLPQQPEAKELSDLYFRHAAWMHVFPSLTLSLNLTVPFLRYTPISEKDYSEIFRHVYDPDAFDEPIPAQDLGLFCIVLAIGTLVDLERPAHSAEAVAFYHLARGAISIDSVLEEQSITAIQALVSNSSLRQGCPC